MSFTARAIEAVLEATVDTKYGDNGLELWTDEYFSDHRSYDQSIGVVTVVDSQTGGEGSAEYIYIVFKVELDGSTRFFKKEGYYASYDGSNWDGDFKEVTPIERTVVFYE